MPEKPLPETDPSLLYEDDGVWGEHPQGVSISDQIASKGAMMSEEDFLSQVQSNEELSRRAQIARERGNVIGIMRAGPSHIKSYVARELHHITDSKAVKVIGIGTGAAVTVYLLQHEIRKHVIPAIQRRQESRSNEAAGQNATPPAKHQ